MLEERHRKVVVAFLNGLSKKDALLKAGYGKSHRTSDIFGREDVQREIGRRQNIMSTKSGVDAEWIIDRLKMIADARYSDILVLDEEGIGSLDLSKMDKKLAYALGEYNVVDAGGHKRMQIKLADKLKALEMLGRHLGLFDDKLKIDGELSLLERLNLGRQQAAGVENNDTGE